jgi:penicillin amidase
LRVAALSGIPAQNLVTADAQGHIGWTICGRIPLRVGFSLATEWWVDAAGPKGATAVPGTFSPDVPHRWGDPPWGAHWDGYLDPSRYPRIVDPPSGRIWTANNRVVDGPMLAVIGDGGFALGARAKQIRDDLMALEHATPQDLLHVQLDDRAIFLERWQTFLLDQLTPEAVAAHPLRAEARGLVERWGGHASVDSVGFRIVRGFRSTVSRDVWRSLTGPCRVDKTFGGPHWQFEGPLWQLLQTQPRGGAPSPFPNWSAFLLVALDRTLADMTKDGTPLAQATWGKRNTVRVGHPLAQGMPSLARWLDMPALELPGADHMPRVQSPTDGASERMVVSPGQEAEEPASTCRAGRAGTPARPTTGMGTWPGPRASRRRSSPGPPWTC